MKREDRLLGDNHGDGPSKMGMLPGVSGFDLFLINGDVSFMAVQKLGTDGLSNGWICRLRHYYITVTGLT